jgi:hypothetical protein
MYDISMIHVYNTAATLAAPCRPRERLDPSALVRGYCLHLTKPTPFHHAITFFNPAGRSMGLAAVDKAISNHFQCITLVAVPLAAFKSHRVMKCAPYACLDADTQYRPPLHPGSAIHQAIAELLSAMIRRRRKSRYTANITWPAMWWYVYLYPADISKIFQRIVQCGGL